MERGWLKHEVFSGEPFGRRSAWIWLIEEAAFAPRQKMVGGTIITLERGQLCHSYRFLAEAWGWKKDRVSRFLKLLISARQIRAETATVGSTANATGEKLITICNYDKYQGAWDNGATVGATANATETRQQRDKLEVIKGTITPVGTEKPSASISPGAVIFTQCLSYLTNHCGQNENTARGLLGKWRNDYGDSALIDAVNAAAQRDDISEPKAWIAGRLKNAAKPEGWAGAL
jgi:hypothetical protein